MLGMTDDTSGGEGTLRRPYARQMEHPLLTGATARGRRSYSSTALPATIQHGQICYRRLNSSSAYMSWTGAAVAKAGIPYAQKGELEDIAAVIGSIGSFVNALGHSFGARTGLELQRQGYVDISALVRERSRPLSVGFSRGSL
jgi:hypothetical protein